MTAKKRAAGYESIRQFFIKKNIMNAVGICILVYALILIIKICRTTFLGIAFPNEYREAANIQLTMEFLKGSNPYSLSAYNGPVPGMIYVYGPLYSLFTALLCLFIPADVVTMHYIVTFVSVIAGALICAYMTYEKTQYLAAPAAVFLFIINCSWRYGYINAVPDAFAVFIMIFVFFIVSRREFKFKDTILAILSLMLFFVKQYFLVVSVSVIIFRFINDRKKAIRLTIQTLLISAAVFITVAVTCPLYFTYTVFMAHGPFGMSEELFSELYDYLEEENAEDEHYEEEAEKEEIKEKGTEKEEEAVLTNNSENTDPVTGFSYEILQLKSLAGMFILVFFFAFAGIVTEAAGGFKHKGEIEFFLIIHMIIAFAALIYLGRNDGAWLSYYLQLFMPAVIIYAFIISDRFIAEKENVMGNILTVLFIVTVTFTAYRTGTRLKIYEKTDEQIKSWERAYEITSNAAKKGEVYYVPPLGYCAFSDGQYLYNNGHNMVVNIQFLMEYNSTLWEQKLFPNAGMVINAHYDEQMKIKEKVKNREYELVTLIDGMDTDYDRLDIADLKKAGYSKTDDILLYSGRLSYDVQFWSR
ncbi:MAG: hypothetical protein K6F86_00310 [Lachnospiraceae bacterium]|nr:hypothetical protein [Lachnospiraceae bacterium]